jgi:acyl carrier protein
MTCLKNIDEEITARLERIISKCLKIELKKIERDMVSDDFEGWDSIAHITIIMNVEQEFQLKFNIRDVKGIKNIGDFIDLIKLKIS